jgi:small subunit ribosomal protein S9
VADDEKTPETPETDEPQAEAPAEEPALEADEATEVAAAPVEDAAAAEEPESAGEAPAEEPESAGEAPAEPDSVTTEAEAKEAPAPAAEEEAEAPAAEAEAPAAEAEAPAAEEDEEDEEPAAPRQRPEIPGADLEVDLVMEGEDERAPYDEDSDEATAEAADEEDELADQPIAEAAIDLAAGARYKATGKRKTAKARVILTPGDGTYTINGKPLDVFFPRATLQRTIRQPLETVGYEDRMNVVARMDGGGVSAQAGALRHGISRALLEADPNLRGELKRRGFLTRDARAKERKKAGLKKARKRPQFSKR